MKKRWMAYAALLVPTIALAFLASNASGATGGRPRAAHSEIMMSISVVAEQVGVRLEPKPFDDEFRIGLSISGTLEHHEKLERFGVKGMKNGARVTMSRIAADRVRLDCDQLDAQPSNAKADIKVDESGHLVASTKA